ncbi:hypothetical protein FE257_010632 [Aspergillus nanangensis]|uniref:Zn(2)-C6 fungal-type domain-containing protein n=1 Tax=Aspergillus nanangensis TaxID=2582783 RepID=A0AAD4CI58_ASPNN|nr:hypothetical protein FE257_010632 [Aspergillus nanangensis]
MPEGDYPYDTNLVRELLKNKRKARGIRSCFPCRHRKVRCDGHVPCSSCVKRNHSELCRVPTSSGGGNEEQPQHERVSHDLVLDGTTTNDDESGGSEAQERRIPLTYQEKLVSLGNKLGSTLSANSTTGTIDLMQAESPSAAGANSLIAKLEKIEEQILSLKADLRGATTAATSTSSPLPGGVGRRTRPTSPGRYVVEDATGATIYLGSHSDTPLALGCRQASTEDLRLHDAMIDQFVPRAYPFTNLWGAEATAKDVCETLPEDSDIIRYWQGYQSTAYPFYPALVTIDQFALALFAFLDQRALSREGLVAAEEPDSSWLALLFAVLACGVQFSDDPIKERDLRSKVLICSSFQCLRTSNFFNHTNLDQIQAMALIGHCLRNNIDTNSAWILMGSTIRLAQSIGIHEASPTLPAAEQSQRSKLWWSLVWQDTFLSLTYDRPLSTLTMSCPIPYQPNTEGFTFQECIFTLCHIILEKARQETAGTLHDPAESMREYKRQLDSIGDNAAPFLADKTRCISLQNHLERLGLGVHLGYAICRLQRVYLSGVDPYPTSIAVDCVQRAMHVVECFLDLHRFSAGVCRSWSFVHNAVSCAITLKSLGHIPLEDQRKPEMLVQRLTTVLEKEEKDSEWCDADTNVRYFGPYSRALKALREIYRGSGN